MHFEIMLIFTTELVKNAYQFLILCWQCGRVVIEHCDCDQHGVGSKPTWAILLCLWERHFMTFSPAWWS